MPVMQLAVAAALAVLTFGATTAESAGSAGQCPVAADHSLLLDSAGSAGQCAVAADHSLLQAKSNMHPSKKLSAQAKLVQESSMGNMESKLASKAGTDSAEQGSWFWSHPEPVQNTIDIRQRFDEECRPPALRNHRVTEVYTIVDKGGVHESFFIHVEDKRRRVQGTRANLVMLMEIGKYSDGKSEPIFAVRCETMPWQMPSGKSAKWLNEYIPAAVNTLGNCLSEIGVLPVVRTLLKRGGLYSADIFTDWNQPCGDGDCPCELPWPGKKTNRRGSWKIRNAMVLTTKTRGISSYYSTYGQVADLAFKYANEKFPHWGSQDDYSLVTNNCQDFAAHMFTTVTGDTVWKAGDCEGWLRDLSSKPACQ